MQAIVTIFTLLGTYLNARKLRAGFFIWIFCNISWGIIDYSNGFYWRVLIDAVQTAFCIYGIIKWGELDGHNQNIKETTKQRSN